ncbi:gamma-glutamyl-gamma-aminobutyrate hydrolase family protein [Streptacidiphilus pinicola]|uniref:gamma-glutamyl-gamma-aminobutyrate hydrolase family protein n=1 Tax=Streptacidiphilus pinicola TaxID=2219663 RepID=UPI00140231FE|nr:gamma-glutamyl-gamma-aminobutyrate hydrolase family protein [Streptacidiphilus pinicola]
MIPVLVTQNVDTVGSHATRSDVLDQRWHRFLHRVGLVPVPVPNDPRVAEQLLDRLPETAGVILTGGNDLVAYGGRAPERDATETLLIRHSLQRGLPLLGVCRGMQLLQHHFHVPLTQVSGHVRERQVIHADGVERPANSYHRWGTTETRPPLDVWATAGDGVVKGVRHRTHPLLGIMWHPERLTPFEHADLDLFRRHFGAA